MRWKDSEYSGWGRILTAQGRIARPEKPAALSGILDESPAPALGASRSYGDAALNDGGDMIDMTRLDRFLGFDPDTGVLEAEAGVSITDILSTVSPKGWMPAVMPGTGFATLGGCIANDVHGKNHHGAGTFGQHVESIELMGVNGKVKRLSAQGNRMKKLAGDK